MLFGRCRLAHPLLAAVCVGALVAIGLPATQSAAEGEPPLLTAKKLRIAMPGAENNLTPFTVTFGATPNTHDLLMMVYDSLFWSQVKPNPDPWLAESATSNVDFTSWTVKLKADLTWHDGKPLTADDILFSFDYYLKNKSASGRYAHHVADVPPYKGGAVIDARTVRLDFAAPAPQFKSLPGADLPIIPKHQWEGITDTKLMTALPIGSGPYQLVEIQPDQLYRLKANPNYVMGKPTVDELDIVIVKDPAAAFAALKTGDVDMVARNVPPELRKDFAGDSNVQVVAGSKFETSQIFFNARKAPLSDPVLRKAISESLNLNTIVDTALLGQGKPGSDTFIHPASPWAVPDPSHKFDVAAANESLDKAGYPMGADKLRNGPDGQPLKFSILVNSFEPVELRAAQLIAEQAVAIGVTFTVEALDPATLRTRRAATVDAVPKYDAYVSTLESHAHVDPDGLYYFFHSPGTKGFGVSVSGFTNAKFDSMVEAATVIPLTERKDELQAAQGVLADEIPGLVLWYRTGEYAFRPGSYGGWVSDPGHGIFTKRSFLPETVKAAHPVTNAAPATTVAVVATTAAPTAATAAASATSSAAASATSSAPASATSSDGGSGALPWVLGVGVVVIAGGLLAFRARRRRVDVDD